MKRILKVLGIWSGMFFAALFGLYLIGPAADKGAGTFMPMFAGAILITPAVSAAIRQSFQTLFNQAFAGVKTYWPTVAMRVPSMTAEEVYAWLSAFPKMREWIGDRVIANLAASDYRIKNKPFELTIDLDEEEIEDEKIGLYSPIIAMGGDSCAKQPDELIFSLLLAGFDTVCFDGQFFFDTDHPWTRTDGSITSVSNFGGGAGAPWFLMDLSRPIKPLVFQDRKPLRFTALDKPDDANVFYKKKYIYGWDCRNAAGFGLWQLAFASKDTLNTTNYSAARAALGSYKKDMSEQPLGIMGTHLVCGQSKEAEARAVLIDERLANGATNTWRNTAELVIVPWLP